MRLVKLSLSNFRAYQQTTDVDIEDFTSFVGRNDAGKSTVLEALEIFFNNKTVKLDQQDANVRSEDKIVTIACTFDDLPAKVVVDSRSETTLQSEYLLTADGLLKVVKKYDCSKKTAPATVGLWARRPTAADVNDLLSLKNADLKLRAEKLGVDLQGVDKRSNTSLRQALYAHVGDLKLVEEFIPLDAEDGKKVWDQLQKFLPLFALFQSDRPNKVDDTEVQDPMKLAVEEAIASVQDELDRIKERVREQATAVAARTIAKLQEMDPHLAAELTPNFKSEPKWEGFKLSLTDDQDIPIDKRGSGVRRLILLNFFRADAERRQADADAPGIIYAVEEPENSQHPSNQIMLVQALKSLAEQDGAQVLLTTHVPAIARLLPASSLRYVTRDPQTRHPLILTADDGVLSRIADELGVLPDKRVRALLCVEGPNDVEFLCRISSRLRQNDPTIPDVATDPRIAIMLLGGGNLEHWVNKNYLDRLDIPQFHIYDRDDENPPKYQAAANQILAKGQQAVLTTKREMENYLHPAAIQAGLNVQVTFGDTDDVPAIVAEAVHNAANPPTPWAQISQDDQKKKMSAAKKRLNRAAADHMTPALLAVSDPGNEIEGWFRAIAAMISEELATTHPVVQGAGV